MHLSRAVFLACSWCWCLGMFFPVFLCRDFGWPGWIAFVVPNMIGAAGMGLVLARPGASEALVRDQGFACRAFSGITILFHVSFLSWFFTSVAARWEMPPYYGALGAGAVILMGVLLARVRTRGWMLLAWLVFGVSILSAILTWRTIDALRLPPPSGEHSLQDLLNSVPVLVLGFLLCPVLDLTFHRVRQETPGRAGSLAFILGFGVFFLALMLYTLLYAGGILAGAMSACLLLHLGAQSAFTIGAHLRELFNDDVVGVPRNRFGSALTIIVLVLAGSAFLPSLPDYRPGYPATRLAYELFMSSYGLLFPAYVWIVIVPRALSRRAAVKTWIVGCLLAAPMMWAGYIEQRYAWLLPAVGVVLAAPVVARAFARPSSRAQ